MTREQTVADDAVAALTAEPDETPNIIDRELAGWKGPGEKGLFAAPAEVRWMAQNLINAVDDHARLRHANILILMEMGITANADGQVLGGKALKTAPLVKLLGGGADKLQQPDFIIKLNAERWPEADDRWRLALLDHELMHCAGVIAGKHIGPAKQGKFIAELKLHEGDFIEVCDSITNEKGWPLVRWWKRGDDGRPVWRVKKHDVQEFVAVVDRWGAWEPGVEALVNVMEKDDDGQMELNLRSVAEEAAEKLNENLPEGVSVSVTKAPGGSGMPDDIIAVVGLVDSSRKDVLDAVQACEDPDQLSRTAQWLTYQAESVPDVYRPRLTAVKKRIKVLGKPAEQAKGAA